MSPLAIACAGVYGQILDSVILPHAITAINSWDPMTQPLFYSSTTTTSTTTTAPSSASSQQEGTTLTSPLLLSLTILREVLDSHSYSSLIADGLIPRLARAVHTWNPRTDPTPLHKWVLPFIQTLDLRPFDSPTTTTSTSPSPSGGSSSSSSVMRSRAASYALSRAMNEANITGKDVSLSHFQVASSPLANTSDLSPVFTTIRQKLSLVLQQWHPKDTSAITALSPWLASPSPSTTTKTQQPLLPLSLSPSPWDPSDLYLFLTRSIFPKLTDVILRELNTDIQSPYIQPLDWALKWLPYILANAVTSTTSISTLTSTSSTPTSVTTPSSSSSSSLSSSSPTISSTHQLLLAYIIAVFIEGVFPLWISSLKGWLSHHYSIATKLITSSTSSTNSSSTSSSSKGTPAMIKARSLWIDLSLWYTTWKQLIPQSIRHHPRLLIVYRSALDLINAHLDSLDRILTTGSSTTTPTTTTTPYGATTTTTATTSTTTLIQSKGKGISIDMAKERISQALNPRLSIPSETGTTATTTTQKKSETTTPTSTSTSTSGVEDKPVSTVGTRPGFRDAVNVVCERRGIYFASAEMSISRERRGTRAFVLAHAYSKTVYDLGPYLVYLDQGAVFVWTRTTVTTHSVQGSSFSGAGNGSLYASSGSDEQAEWTPVALQDLLHQASKYSEA